MSREKYTGWRYHEDSEPEQPTCEQSVCDKIQKRRELGVQKYGTTMERTDLTKLQWLNHAQEEAMDLAIYLEKLIRLEGEEK